MERCPIGRPVVASTGLNIVDAQLQRLPCGLPGELLITGAGLAEGYHLRPELTAAQLVTLPETGERADRTGDLALRLGSGELLHLGRRDHQVKLRGYRIELGEIEAALCAHPQIESAVVGVHGGVDDQRLLAWIVGTESAPSAAELRAHLAGQLPAYMLPQHFLSLAALPLLPNGKLDRARLPLPNASDASRAELRQAAGSSETLSPAAQTLLEIARELLGSAEVQLGDNVFDAGGHSLLALTLATRIESSLVAKLSLLPIAQGSLAALAAQIESAQQGAPVAAEAQPSPRSGARVARLFGLAR